MTFRNTIDFLASCIFTKRCRFCNRVCDVRDEICSRCADDIHRIEGEICNNCGCNKTLFNHKERKHFFESICAPYYYEGAPQKAVIHLKHKINPNILTRLAEDMSECVKERYKELEFDYITYVPMHQSDIKQRGYNQAQALAEEISKNLSIPCYPLINKDYSTKSQHILRGVYRTGNLMGALSFNKKAGIDVSDTRILIVDDIKTTGATLDECAKALLYEGCAEVRCVTACIGTKNKIPEDDKKEKE